MARLAELLAAQVGTVTMTDQGPGDSAPSGSSDTPSTSDSSMGDVSEEDRQKFFALLQQNPDFRKEATKSVRKAEIDRRAGERAEQMLSSRIAQLEESNQAITGQNLALLERLEAITFKDAPEEEQKVYRANKKATVAQVQARSLASRSAQYERDQNRNLVLTHLRDVAGMDEGVLEDISDVEDDDEFVAATIAALSKTQGLTRVETARLKAQLAGKTRNDDGTSVFAAASPSASGGQGSLRDIENAWNKDPGNARLSKLYYQARSDAGM